MKPFSTEIQNTEALLELGRASVQIVHDLKNQVNGLKLYATFLRKRFEKQDRPADERETINKIIHGLERAAADMTTLVRFGRPLELQPQPHADLARLLKEAVSESQTLTYDESEAFHSEFDAEKLSEALKIISAHAQAAHAPAQELQPVWLRREEAAGNRPFAVIEWHALRASPDDEVFHSFAGSAALRMALAARIIRAHGGDVVHNTGNLRARLPLKSSDE